MLRPPTTFAELPVIPDALLVDLELNTTPPEGDPASYYGTTLAAEVRMRQPSCPIVLVTRPEVSGPTTQQQRLQESRDFDLILLKEDIHRDPDGERAKIKALIQGFQMLAGLTSQNWKEVLDSMEASEEESNLLREAAQPAVQGQWDVAQVARWIRNVVMGFPGILYDDLTSATRLGMTLESFRLSPVQKLLDSARYTGVFGTYQERWWRDRLFAIAQDLVQKHDLPGPISSSFATAFEAEYDQPLELARCVYDGEPIADWVCYVLKLPVKLQHSIPYYPDNRPAIMDEARVSFKAIMQSNDFDETKTDPDSYEVVRQLWEQG